jgi:hypothetical protein
VGRKKVFAVLSKKYRPSFHGQTDPAESNFFGFIEIGATHAKIATPKSTLLASFYAHTKKADRVFTIHFWSKSGLAFYGIAGSKYTNMPCAYTPPNRGRFERILWNFQI